MPTRRFWGWGYEEAGPEPAMMSALEAALAHWLGMESFERLPRPRLEDFVLRRSRLEAPRALARILTDDPFERASHAYGKSYRDLIRCVARRFDHPPDLVAVVENEQDVVDVLDFCDRERAAVIPFGGGSSVCGGVEPDTAGAFERTVSLDLRRLDQVLEVDLRSRAARIQAGVFGPALEAQLRPHGVTLRHFPQSFEFSSLGGWIATRSGGHYATLITHIDELVEGLRVVTPTGLLETRRLPGSGAGPSPERWFIGSEGILGVITEAWMRLQSRPTYRASFAARFKSFAEGAEAARALAQSGLYPSNCRLLDATEAMMSGAGSGDDAVLLVGFESADHPLDAWVQRAAELCRDSAGIVPNEALRRRADSAGQPGGAAEAWRSAFLRAPYLRDELVLMGCFCETFETAVTWANFADLHAAVTHAAQAVARDGRRSAIVACRLTHVYPDGAAPYFTVIAPAARGAELEQWATVKEAITTAMLDHGGTTTHHHAVGRDFRRYYEKERPEGFARALAAAKRALDPRGLLNPGVLLPAGVVASEGVGSSA
jgi:alkyldihydroxyacetonephosphate synthase